MFFYWNLGSSENASVRRSWRWSVLLLLLAVVHTTSVVAQPLPPGVLAVQNLSDVTVPPPPENRPACVIGFDSGVVGTKPLQSLRVLVVLAPGATAYHVTTAYQYYTERGALVEFFCANSTAAGPGTVPVALLDVCVPKHVVRAAVCITDASLVDASSYSVVVVPGGYASVLSIRTGTNGADDVLSSFLSAATPAQPSRALVTLDEGAEVLIELEVLPTVSNTSLTGFPYTTLSVANAAVYQNASSVADAMNASTHVAVATLTPSHWVSTGVWLGVTNDGLGSGTEEILVAISRQVLGFTGDYYYNASIGALDVAAMNCSDSLRTNPYSFPAEAFGAVDPVLAPLQWTPYANQDLLGNGTNLNNVSSQWNATNLVIPLLSACLNAEGVNLCAGKRMGVVVSSGTHDMQLIPLLHAIAAAGAQAKVYCPDNDEGSGFVYTMPFPAILPTFSVACTHYYNESYIVYDDYIFVPGGPVATHRRLRVDRDIVAALSSAHAYYLYGSSLVLLAAMKEANPNALSYGDVPVTTVPDCVLTNTDMKCAGFSIQAFNGSDASALVHYSDSATRQIQRLLGGYHTLGEVMAAYSLWVETAAQVRAWNDATVASVDRVVGAVFISVAVVVVAAVVAFKIVQRRLKVNRQYAPVNSTEDDAEALY